jgi:hypothetical protein
MNVQPILMIRVAMSLLGLALVAAPAAAQGILEEVQIHGFGGWAYGKTDGNAYLIGRADGEYHNADFALNVTAQPVGKLRIVAQLRAEVVAGDEELELDYGFASWKISKSLAVRVGRVKHPFGIYGEIYDVGTLRPFYLLPRSIYGANGYTARAYNGVGVIGWKGLPSGWGVQYDIYGGQIEGDFVIPGMLTTDPVLFFEPEINVGFEVNQALGIRVNVTTPVPGFTFGVSAYAGDDEVFFDLPKPLEEDAIREVMLGSVEYLDHRWTVRAEYGTLKRGIDFELAGGFIEAACKLSDHWQLAGRFDSFEIESPSIDLSQLPPYFTQLLKHDELAVGVNYWFSSHFVVRLSYHKAEGNRAAFLDTQEELMELLMTGKLDDRTGLIVFGGQYSF